MNFWKVLFNLWIITMPLKSWCEVGIVVMMIWFFNSVLPHSENVFGTSVFLRQILEEWPSKLTKLSRKVYTADCSAWTMTATKMDLPEHLKSRSSGPTEYQMRACEGSHIKIFSYKIKIKRMQGATKWRGGLQAKQQRWIGHVSALQV